MAPVVPPTVARKKAAASIKTARDPLSLFLNNFADCFAVVAGFPIVCNFTRFTAPLGAPFVSISYNVTDDSTKEPALYSTGFADLFFVFFVMSLAIALVDVVQFGALYAVKRLGLSKADQNSAAYAARDIFFALFILGFTAAALSKYTNNISFLWVGYPHFMLAETKIAILAHVGFYIHLIVTDVILELRKDLVTPDHLKNGALAALILVGYFLNFNRALFVLLALHDVAWIITSVCTIVSVVHRQGKKADEAKAASTGFRGLATHVSYLTSLVAAALHVALAVVVFGYGLSTVVNEDAQEGDFNNGLIRAVALVVLVGVIAKPFVLPATKQVVKQD